MTVKISVLMPIYRTPIPYLRMAIDSILGQTYTDFEFLIMDDCPEDDREEVVKSYNDPRIIYLKNKENMGISQARNKLIDMAKGEYLAVMDHDDLSMAERFEKEVAYLDAHPEVGVVGCWAKSFYNKVFYCHPEDDITIKVNLMDHSAVIHPTSMIRKSVLNKTHVRYEANFSPAEDYCLWLRLMEHTKFHNVTEILFRYRNHLHNTTCRQINTMLDVGDELRYMIHTKYPELYEQYQKWNERCILSFFKGKSTPFKEPKVRHHLLKLNNKAEVVLKKPILVHVHIYYTELWKELKSCIQSIPPYPFDLYVTMVEECSDIQADIKQTFPEAHIEVVENCGCDIGPFVHMLNQINLGDYEYVMKVHTNLKNHKTLTKYLQAFQNKSLGMIGNYKLLMRAGYEVYEEKKDDPLIKFIVQQELPILQFSYVAKAAFICRPDVLRPVQSMSLKLTDFEAADLDKKVSLASVMEKMFGYYVECLGYICEDPVTPKWKIGCFRIMEKIKRYFGNICFKKTESIDIIPFDGKERK